MRTSRAGRMLALISLAASCRQLLDIEPARMEEPAAGSGAPSAGSGQSGSGGAAGSGGSGAESSCAIAGTAGVGVGAQAVGGDGSTDAGSGASAGSGGAFEAPLCERYCATLAANCPGDLAQYSDEQTCLDTCAILPAGSPGDSGVDTVECRVAEAEKAGRLEPEFYCPLAGPVGGDKCGSDCEGFCTIMAAFCTAERTNGEYYYPDLGSCLAECATLPVAPEPYSATLHTVGPYLQCRIFHACAADIDADYHCGHALGEAPCAEIDGGL